MTLSLFEPFKIGPVEAKNRLVRSATSERMADSRGRTGEELRKVYSLLCRGGIGIVITGHAFVRADGKSNASMTGADSDENIPSLAELARETHRRDVPIVLQINHAGAFASAEVVQRRICVSLADPALGSKTPGSEQLHELTQQEVWDLIDSYCFAAARAEEAGCDGVQLHCAHGYLIGQFLAPRTNRRKDEFGGSPDNRARFVKTIVERVCSRKGKNFIVGVKWNCEDFIENGLSATESLAALQMLVAEGISFAEISGGVGDAVQTILRKDILKPEQEAYFLAAASPFRDKIEVPLGLVGGIRCRETAEMVIQRGFDFVSMSRPLIRQPDLPLRLAKGERATCVSCNRCLLSKKGGMACRRQ